MATKYGYTKSPVDIGRLSSEILAEPGITTTLLYCNFKGPNTLDIFFDSSLSESEETLLDAIVANHIGEPIPEEAILPTGDLAAGMVTVSDGEGTATWVNVDDLMYIVLGSNEFETSAESESSTTSTNWQQKLRLALTDLAAGKYRIDWYYEWAYDNGNFQFKSRVQIDDSDTYMEQEVRPTPASTDKYRDSSGFAYVNLTSGDHDIDLDYCSSKNGKTAYIRRARISARRVS
jgi:hypothetical protein